MVEVAQGTNPTQKEPIILDNEAMKSASDDLATLLANAPARKRGRPVGSKNRPKTDEHGNFIPPGQRPPPKKEDKDDDAAKAKQRIEDKKSLAKKREEQILHELNDGLMGELVSLGIPQALLFNEGFGPQASQVNPAYTPLAQQIAIPPRVAKLAAMTAAEAEYSSIGDTVMSAVYADSPIRLVILALATAIVAIPWLGQLNEVRKNVNQFMEAKQRFDQQQAAAANMPMDKVVG